ncbi:hypothetical protein LUZ63_017494 [Rhynchospora breviuscula]|uniref:Protein TIC 100 n=1 Tax=Rhynchospora breviuscula TaxID=2022672 RepID=A0A9Q0C2L3_9POAL|nr:hypothetical protein LUZ63_017494 [Rhynchospora breviuscula]
MATETEEGNKPPLMNEEEIGDDYDLDDSSSSSSSDSDSDSDRDESEKPARRKRPVMISDDDDDDDDLEVNYQTIKEVLNSPSYLKRKEQQDRVHVQAQLDDPFDFPPDPEKWREADLRELWADPSIFIHNKPGWDPVFADEEDWAGVSETKRRRGNPPIAPFYMPYRKPNPVIPFNHYDISNPKAVVEELDRIEEFLIWASYIFPDGSSYEGTVWDDLAHGKGVFVDEDELVRYEGEWFQNQMEGHGVVEVDIPEVQPVPGSNLEMKMRKQGRIITRDFMTDKDREWLEKDMEDTVQFADSAIPFYERKAWLKYFGWKPEKGRYRYAGQWKHGRMHGCGVYEVNGRIKYGKWYFGQLMKNDPGCDLDVSAMHAGIAEVAAAKARMFTIKPNGMVREQQALYSDPQHPYFYEEEDVWMAPGFVNQFYDVPDFWTNYVEEVDKEREMWLNSFYKSPLRIPMPAELEHWWFDGGNDHEFVLINKEPEPDPEDPSKLVYTEDPLIVHTPSGRLINFVEDEEYGVRLFWQPERPPPETYGETEQDTIDVSKARFLPFGYNEFFGIKEETDKEEEGLIEWVGNALKSWSERLEKWGEEKKKTKEMNLQLLEKEMDFVEAKICLEEAVKDMETELEKKQREEERKVEKYDQEETTAVPVSVSDKSNVGSSKENVDQVGKKDGYDGDSDSEDDDDDDDEDDDGGRASFGTVKKSSPFSSLSLSAVSSSFVSTVPSCLQESFFAWRKKEKPQAVPHSSKSKQETETGSKNWLVHYVRYCTPANFKTKLRLRPGPARHQKRSTNYSHLASVAQSLWTEQKFKDRMTIRPRINEHDLCSRILSLNVPIPHAY